MLKTLIIATVLLPVLAFAQQSQQLPQPRRPPNGAPWAGFERAMSVCAEALEKIFEE